MFSIIKRPVKKPEHLLHLGKVDISSIQEFIQKIPTQQWQLETKNRDNDFFCFDDTQHILFIFANGKNHENYQIKPLWNFWRTKFEPLIEAAVAPYAYENGIVVKAMLAKLKAGGVIKKHVDFIVRDKYVHKIHIPIITHPDAKMLLNEKTFHLEAGNAYEVNNIDAHAVNNNSEIDRIHFIFEYYEKI